VRCWNCDKDIPDAAKTCQFCEAAVEAEPTAGEMEVVQEMLGQMNPEVLEALRNAFQRSECPSRNELRSIGQGILTRKTPRR
jgi:hypothetical protein